MYLSREQILNAKDVVTEEVNVPEWGGKVLVKGMTGSERDKFEQTIIDDENKLKKDNIRAKLVALTVVDEKHNPIFKAADIEALGKKSAKALARVYDVAARLSGITKEDVEELEKNSGKTTTDTSASS